MDRIVLCRSVTSVMLLLAFAAQGAFAGEDLMELVMSFDDPHMTSYDLAFFLATHDFDATPKAGYVIVNLDDKVYKLTPNGEAAGLADIEEMGGA
ncbi:MAG: hypothetical protein JW986_05285 [Methanotrichaceae archaeon]|nr:hypothetical protein [Methanotrichaceae archaeon]